MRRKDVRGTGTDHSPPAARLEDVGAEELFQNMAARHAVVLYRSARGRTSSAADAADLVQEAFEKALRVRPPARNDLELRKWLLVVLRNLSIDDTRARAVRSSLPYDLFPIPAAEPEAIPLWRQMDIEAVYAVLPRLASPFRRAFELRLAGHRPRDIARQLGVSERTLGVQLHRARKRLKTLVLAHFRRQAEGRAPGRFAAAAVPPSNDVYLGGLGGPPTGPPERRDAGA